jgi:hypothetical protein
VLAVLLSVDYILFILSWAGDAFSPDSAWNFWVRNIDLLYIYYILLFVAAYNVSSIRVLGDDLSGPHSTAIIIGLKTVLACAHSLALEPAGERGLKYVEDYWIQERVTKSFKGECIEENRVPLKLYKFHAENDWALFQRSDDKCFEKSEIALIDKELETKPTLSYLRCNATVLHCPVALFASIQKVGEFSIGCDQSDIRIQGQSTHHVKYEGRDLVRGSSGGGIFMAPSGNLLAMHVEAIVEADYEASEESGAMQIMPTDKKSASGEPHPYSHFQVHEAGSPAAKKAKCDSDTIASLAGGNNGRGSALIICKFPRLMYHINCLEESVTKMSGKS